MDLGALFMIGGSMVKTVGGIMQLGAERERMKMRNMISWMMYSPSRSAPLPPATLTPQAVRLPLPSSCLPARPKPIGC
jgi:hypothetical protein